MSKVTVEFVGICTHFGPQHLSHLLRPRHRVVLVRSDGGVRIREVDVPEHVVQLRWSMDDATYDLHGVTLWLEPALSGASLTPFSVHPTFEEVVPVLTRLVAPISTLSEPSPAVVLGHSASEASCYFDIDFGTLYGAVDESDAVYATLVAESPDSDFVLRAAPFPDGSLPHGLRTETPLPDGAVISVANIDSDRQPKKAVDFLLHYLTAAHMPPIPQLPPLPARGSAATTLPRRPPAIKLGTIGAGCSNSSYP